MNFRTVKDLNLCIVRNLHHVPAEVDLIAGIPRSGLLAANLLALYLNRPPTDLEGLVEGRMIGSGVHRPLRAGLKTLEDARHILLVDDSLHTGRQLEQARARLRAAGLKSHVTTAAVYVEPAAAGLVDVAFELCSAPRFFEWNLMHHTRMGEFCLDLDGVICVDPTDGENDDGPAYEVFLGNARPLFLPTQRVGRIVTSRLEKYRDATEGWLRANGVEYDELVMLDLPNKQARVASNAHASFKAGVYRGCKACLFIESSPYQAREIARLSGKPVVSMQGPELIEPSGVDRARSHVGKARDNPRKVLGKSLSYLSRKLQKRAGNRRRA